MTRVFHPLTGTASLSYDWTPDVTAYATYGRSYRRGSAQLGVNPPGYFSEASNFVVGVRGPDRRWELTLFARNLFDTAKISAIGQGEQQIATRLLSGTGAPTPFRSGYRSVAVTPPREVGLTASYNF